MVVYFDQFSGAVCTRKLVKILFWAVFNLKRRKKVENYINKYFNQLLGARSTHKLVEIHNMLVQWLMISEAVAKYDDD